MTRVILCRHGETDWHIARRLPSPEVALNERGRAQAHALATRLNEEEISAIFSSTLKRAQETAEIIGVKLGLIPHLIEELKDWDYGDWRGLLERERKERDPELYRLWLKSPHEAHFSHGESLAEVGKRVLTSLVAILESHREDTVLIVAHDAVCRVILCSLLDLDDSHHRQFTQEIASLSIFQRDDSRIIIETVNDTCHLRPLND